MKSVQKRLKEGRCQGIGPEYEPFVKAQEAKSSGTAACIPDPIEGRQVHLLSATETELYYMLRLGAGVSHFREQMLLNMDAVNRLLEKRGLPRVGDNVAYTTDLLTDYEDGRRIAYSVKWSREDFDIHSRQYRGRENRYYNLIIRQDIEMEYWKERNTEFCIVTREDINHVLATNNRLLFSYYDNSRGLFNTQQRMLYLMARGYITWPWITSEFIVPAKLVEHFPYDIDSFYERVTNLEKEAKKYE